MFIRKRSEGIQKKRHIVLVIKSTNSHQYNPEEGDRITQIACVEMMNGELTGNVYNTFINPNNPELLAECARHYRDNLDAKSAATLLRNITEAPTFKDIQPALLAFLGDPSSTRVIVHFAKYVLDFMRHELDADGKAALGKFKIENMLSKAAKLSHTGQYNGGKYPSQIDNNREKLSKNTRAFYKFDEICSEFKVSTRLRTGYSAIDDANMLAKAERNRLNLVREEKRHDTGTGHSLSK